MRIALFGDSIAQGLGVQGRSYLDILSQALRAEGCNFAGTAMQVSDSIRSLPEALRLEPDVVIVAHGITEAMVRPTQRALRYVPQRWRRAGWLDPRPYFSNRWHRKLAQRLESAIRWRVKVWLMRRFGGEVWTPPEVFQAQLAQFIAEVLCKSNADVMVLTHCGVDDEFFPGSSQSLSLYLQRVEQVVASHHDRVHLCDITQVCRRWDDFFYDHFHPNASGHAKIAAVLASRIRTMWEMKVRRGFEE